jgi:hypothetical protein
MEEELGVAYMQNGRNMWSRIAWDYKLCKTKGKRKRFTLQRDF